MFHFSQRLSREKNNILNDFRDYGTETVDQKPDRIDPDSSLDLHRWYERSGSQCKYTLHFTEFPTLLPFPGIIHCLKNYRDKYMMLEVIRLFLVPVTNVIGGCSQTPKWLNTPPTNVKPFKVSNTSISNE